MSLADLEGADRARSDDAQHRRARLAGAPRASGGPCPRRGHRRRRAERARRGVRTEARAHLEHPRHRREPGRPGRAVGNLCAHAHPAHAQGSDRDRPRRSQPHLPRLVGGAARGGGWAAIDKIPRQDWMAYLRWYRRVLALPVRNGAKLALIEPLPDDGLHRLHLADGTALLARKVVLATGIQGGGEWHVPGFVKAALPASRYAHTSEYVDYAALAGKRIAILGGGASAFDNAATALEAGVAAAHVFIRRPELPRVNPIRFMERVRAGPALPRARRRHQICGDGELLRPQPAADHRHVRSRRRVRRVRAPYREPVGGSGGIGRGDPHHIAQRRPPL